MTELLIPSGRLEAGSHGPNDGAACLLEAVAFVAGEPWSDHPECVAPVLATFGRNLNDALPDELRQRLVPFIPKLVGTAGDPVLDERRGYMALDWLVRTYLPAWLRLAPALVSDADALVGMRPVDDLETAAVIGEMVREASTRAAAVGAAARAAAGAALAPTVTALQESAIALFAAMIEVRAADKLDVTE